MPAGGDITQDRHAGISTAARAMHQHFTSHTSSGLTRRPPSLMSPETPAASARHHNLAISASSAEPPWNLVRIASKKTDHALLGNPAWEPGRMGALCKA